MPKRSKQSSLETKKGEKGAAAQFVTRAAALRKLQLSLRDFRKLCILKGIYPRDPKRKTKGTDKTYYHMKDIKFLAHEPLLEKFRELKTFLRKVNRVKERKEFSEARRMRKNKPQIRVQHLVRERYPAFVDALRDLDDALCLVALFAQLPGSATAGLNSTRLDFCSRLIREFHNIVARNGWLQSAFLSVKGVYYRAVIQDQNITWLVPHAFTPYMPKDVDYRVMSTFLQFYETFVKFVNFRLYKQCNIAYPPALDTARDDEGAVLGSLRMESDAQRKLREQKEAADRGVRKVLRADRLLERLAAVARRREGSAEADAAEAAASSDAASEAKQAPVAVESDAEDDDDDDDAAADAAAAEGEATPAAVDVVTPRIFQKFVFHLGREVPLAPMEFIILSLGGRLESDPKSPAITHRVVDRPVRDMDPNCNYVQPQWVVDSLNRRMALPVRHYGPGVQLPAHLSPFVQYQPGDYVPPDELLFAQWTHTQPPAGVDGDFSVADGVVVAAAAAAAAAASDDDASDAEANADEDEESDSDENEDAVDADVKELGKSMMKSKHRRLLAKIERARRAKGARVELLRRKRKAYEMSKADAAETGPSGGQKNASEAKEAKPRSAKRRKVAASA